MSQRPKGDVRVILNKIHLLNSGTGYTIPWGGLTKGP